MKPSKPIRESGHHAIRKSPYVRIMKAAKLGKGVHLSAEEVAAMSMDTAISELALNDEECGILSLND